MMVLSNKILLIKEAVVPEILLDSLGIKASHKTSKELRCACPIHKGDNQTSFRFNAETKKFVCFSHHCEQRDGRVNNDVVGLVQAVKGCNFFEAVKYLSALTGVSLEGSDSEAYYKVCDDLEKKRYVNAISRLTGGAVIGNLSEHKVNITKISGSPYFVRRGYSKELLEYFEVGSFVDDYGIFRAAIPIRDENGNLVDLAGRVVDESLDVKRVPKYRHLYDFPKKHVLYNLDKAKEYIINDPDRRVIMVEGYTDVWSLVRLGYVNTVGYMGSLVLPEQAALISRYALSAIILRDGDAAGKLGAQASKLNLRGLHVTVPNIDDGYDPAKLSDEKILTLLGGGS